MQNTLIHIGQKHTVVVSSIGILLLFGLFSPLHTEAAEFRIPDVVSMTDVLAPNSVAIETQRPHFIKVSWEPDFRMITPIFDASAIQQADRFMTLDQMGTTHYTIRLFENTTDQLVKTLYTDDTEVELADLQPNRGYTVKIVAERDGQYSVPTILHIRTLPKKVQNVRVRTVQNAKNGYAKKLIWNESKGKIDSYIVKIYKKGKKQVERTYTVESPHLLITGLHTGTQYQVVTIAKHDDTHVSPRSKRKIFRFGE